MRALDEKEATFASRERRKKKEKEREQVAGCCCCCCLLRPAMFNFKTGDFFFSLLVRLVETAHQRPLRDRRREKKGERRRRRNDNDDDDDGDDDEVCQTASAGCPWLGFSPGSHGADRAVQGRHSEQATATWRADEERSIKIAYGMSCTDMKNRYITRSSRCRLEQISKASATL